jgi:hypothetical protein
MTRSTSARLLAIAAFIGVAAACADTSAPAPPSDEVLLVVNSTEASLSIVPVENPSGGVKIPLGGTTPSPVGVSAFNGVAIVPMGLDNSVAVVDLHTGNVDIIPLEANSGATGSAIVDDSIAYVANPNLNTVTRVNYLTGDTASVAVGVYPQGVVYTRGRIFVMNGNLVTFAVAGESWITVIDPTTNAKASGIDSIPLPGPGNAGFADVAVDGLIYVMNTGGYNPTDLGRLSTVDPVDRTELGNFGGFGNAPGPVAASGSLLFISSYAEGTMVFDTGKNKVIHGAGDGAPIPGNASVAVDSKGRVYSLESGPCFGGTPGVAHVLNSNLDQVDTITLGECSVGALVTFVPPL